MTDKLTEKEIRQIAREEAMGIFEKGIKEVKVELSEVKKLAVKNSKTLGKIERLLLGEFGDDSEETLKTRATFAYRYAKKNTDLRIIERALPALRWFEDMNTPDKGSDVCKLDILGKIITGWTARKWLGNLLGIVNIATLIGLIILIVNLLDLV